MPGQCHQCCRRGGGQQHSWAGADRCREAHHGNVRKTRGNLAAAQQTSRGSVRETVFVVRGVQGERRPPGTPAPSDGPTVEESVS